MYKVRFLFDYCAQSCIWGCEGEGVLPLDIFPIPDELFKRLENMCDEFDTILNWDDPASGFVWTDEQIEDFRARAEQAYTEYVAAVAGKCEVENWINR